MITGASHNLSSNLVLSTNQFRMQLEQQNSTDMPKQPDHVETTGAGQTHGLSKLSSTETPPPAEMQPVAPEEPSHPSPTPIEESRGIDMEPIIEASEENRDIARQAAVQAEGIRHTNNLIDTYMDATPDDASDSSSDSAFLDPAEVYSESRDYLRRMDMIAAFEKVAEGDLDRPSISVMV
jgi:hypothetical protein